MFTILFTMAGVVVFVISAFTAGLKSAAKRLGGLVITGIVLDCIIVAVMFIVALCHV